MYVPGDRESSLLPYLITRCIFESGCTNETSKMYATVCAIGLLRDRRLLDNCSNSLRDDA